MSGESSFWCSSFSRFWWWLLALLGLPLLFFLMTQFQQKKVEADLSTRVSEALAAENIDWAEVDVNQRGRDVLLKGMPGSDAERDQAVRVAQGVYGVNRVDYDGDMVDVSDDKVADASQQEDNGASTEEAKADPVVVADAKDDLLPAELKMSMDGDQLVLDGKMSSQAQVNALQRAASLHVGVAKVVNNLEVSDKYADADWLKGVGDLMGALPAGSEVVVKNDTLELTGDVDSENARATFSSQAGSALQGSGLQLLNALTVVVPQSDETEQQQTAAECQERLNAAMQDKKIQFTFNKANVDAKSHSLLDNLGAIIGECGGDMKGISILIGGHTDSVGRDAYNLDLSQRRADAVSAYLKSKGIDGAMLETKGFGESKPVASNGTASGQAQNRRITFEIKQKLRGR
uniref:OmpA-like domain-containing protein n=1 Tax=uncultured Thiotrichaceae bacterium TaxID=298394 RepID=A0A6S6SSA7_9GAMM|nr:MAG: Unknown protein [uncultured Thiotrichaceae bacterium]